MRKFLHWLGRFALYGCATFALVLLIAFLYFRVVQHRRSGEPQQLLDQADALAWNNQWLQAEPVYKRAEELFLRRGDPSRALYAHVSQIIPQAESRSIPATILELTQDVGRPEAHDADTRLRILTIRGMIEVNYDARMARETWSQVATIATKQGHWLLASRATGEEGISAFLLGDIATAKNQVLAAWGTAKVFHDEAAHVRYASVYGAGLNEFRRRLPASYHSR